METENSNRGTSNGARKHAKSSVGSNTSQPYSVAYQVHLFMRFSRQEYWSELPCPLPGDLPDPEIESGSLISPALASRFFTTSTTWEALFEPDGLINLEK